ncbi:MAG: hypothetical protein ACOYIK_03940 [Coriobacteriales bacterium]|jgi:hypothetical protein
MATIDSNHQNAGKSFIAVLDYSLGSRRISADFRSKEGWPRIYARP